MTPAPPESAALSRGHSLRRRMAFVVGLAMVLILGCSVLISTLLVRHFFADLQDSLVKTRIERVATVLDLQAQAKVTFLRDSAEWDETYNFLEGTDDEFLQRHFDPEVNSTEEDLIMAFDNQRNLRGVVQPREETGDAYQIPAGLDLSGLASSRLFGSEAAAGLALVGDRVMLLAAHPTTRSDLSGPANGWLVFGAYLDGLQLEELSALSGAPLEIFPLAASAQPLPDGKALTLPTTILGGLEGFYPPVLSPAGGSAQPKFRISLPALSGSREIAVESTLSMLVFQYAMQARNRIILLSIGCGAALLIITLVVTQKYFLNPLAALDQEIQEISRTEGAPRFLAPRRNDEIGRLAESANRLLRRVFDERSRAQEQEELLSSILESATEGVLALRAVSGGDEAVSDFRIVLYNRFAERLFRAPASAVLGQLLSQRFPAFFSAGITQRILRLTQTRQAETFETYYEDPSLRGWFRISLAPWGDGVVMTCNDITERKTREEELAASYAEVERFNAAMIGRELRIVDMKAEVNVLRERLGLPPVYESPSHDS